VSREGNAVSNAIPLRRRLLMRVHCGLNLSCIVAACIVCLAPLDLSAPYVVGGVILGLGAGLVIGYLPAKRWGDDTYSRYVFAVLVAAAVAGLGAAIGSANMPAALLGLGAVSAALALLVFLREQGLRLEVGDEGIRYVSRFSRRADYLLRWERVESLKADVRIIARASLAPIPALFLMIRSYCEGRGLFGCDEIAKFEVRGEGRRLVFDNVTYRLPQDMAKIIIERGREGAVNWSIRRIRETVSVRLGPVEVTRQALLLKRSSISKSKTRQGSFGPFVLMLNFLLVVFTLGIWLIALAAFAAVRRYRGPLRVDFAGLREVAIEDELLRIETSADTLWLRQRNIPNGMYLVQIIHEAIDLPDLDPTA
jgi:hypothetical protein